jgi:hypothetical protein
LRLKVSKVLNRFVTKQKKWWSSAELFWQMQHVYV